VLARLVAGDLFSVGEPFPRTADEPTDRLFAGVEEATSAVGMDERPSCCIPRAENSKIRAAMKKSTEKICQA